MDVILLIYAIIMLRMSFSMFRKWKTVNDHQYSYSIIAACRNEEERLPRFLASLEHLSYPVDLYEIILVDDASDDNSLQILNDFAKDKPHVQVISILQEEKTGKGKRQALSLAAFKAKNEILLFTDADTEVPENWISSYNSYFYTLVGMVIGYVRLKNLTGMNRVKRIFSSGLFCSTAGMGMPFSCSGGNMAIKRSVFEEIGGYEGLGDFHAGDDKLLLKQVAKTGQLIAYNADVKVIEQNRTYTFRQWFDRELRHFGKFRQSALLFQIVTILGMAFFLFLPLMILHQAKWLPFIYIITPIYFFYTCSIMKHKERFQVFDYLLLILYPYYVIFFTIIGTFRKAVWKA